jgi:hypothetical protein
MRLLDCVAHSNVPASQVSTLDAGQTVVTGPGVFAGLVAGCPLRYVLGDDLTHASADLAFADGARLVGCLDLLRMPAPLMWIEWNDETHKRVIHKTHANVDFDTASTGRKVGVLLRASANGLSAVARTFWADAAADEQAAVTLSPLETHIDLRGEFAGAGDAKDILLGGFLDVTDSHDSSTAALLDHVKFRFDQSWASYYRPAAADAVFRRRLIKESIGSIVWDAPFLIAFLLLLSAKDATRRAPVSRTAINRKRLANGRAPLLDHIEVNACLHAVSTSESAGELSERQSPRLHHVRGHLVRRENSVFWRVPHLRGSAARGAVHSRTVCLSFARKGDQEIRI